MRGFCKIATLTLAVAIFATQAGGAQPIPIAVLDFDYSDSSGEPQDQTALHRARLEEFANRIRAALANSGAYRVVALNCPAEPCSARHHAPDALFAMARQAGATLLLFGGVHKMSTLVQWSRVELIDVANNRLLDERHLSFRGDDAEAWRRAADYVAQKLVKPAGAREPPP